jgi:hypothetical protein
MRPIVLEIVSKVLTTFDPCRHCKILFDQAGLDQKIHQKEMNEYPSDVEDEFMKLSDWVRELKRFYKHRLFVKLIDIQSPLGMYKSLRYRIRTYPTFIVEGKETYAGWDKDHLEVLLDRYMMVSPPLKSRTL